MLRNEIIEIRKATKKRAEQIEKFFGRVGEASLQEIFM